MAEEQKDYISRQIAVYKTDKKLVEFVDKLKLAPTNYYAHIHSLGDKDENGVKQISCIGIVLQDYSGGKGSNTQRVMANISPDEAEYIFLQLKNGTASFEFKQEKIFGEPDKEGKSMVTKLRIIRATTGADGKARKYPWYVEIANGTGKKVKTEKGGVIIQSQSYEEKRKVYVNINDLDFFRLMSRVSKFIAIWEYTVGPHVIIAGKQAIAEGQKVNEAS